MRNPSALAVLLVIALASVAAWPWSYEEEEAEDTHNRYKRASWKPNKEEADDCPAGTQAIITCEPCPVGYYTAKDGLWKTCVECDEDKTTLPTDTSKCVKKCDAGQTWSYLRWKCLKCEEGFYKAEDGNHNCTACPKYYNPYSNQTGCGDIECPKGFEPRNLSDGSLTCAPCRLGSYKKKVGGATDFCDQCDKNRWTISTGSFTNGNCIKKIGDSACEASYPELARALQGVAYDMTDNDTDTLIEALCSQSENLTALKIHFDNCKNVVHAGSGLVMLPVYIDDTKIISLVDAFNDTTPTCPENFTRVGAFGGGSGLSGWSASGSGMFSWSGRNIPACTQR